MIMINEIDVLGVFAHPDDAELQVGGTLLKMKSLGYSTVRIGCYTGRNGNARYRRRTRGRIN